jgi:S1-C subfamily serine protease
VVVEGVMPGSAAMEAGLLPDDVIVKMNGKGFAMQMSPSSPA